jgi:transcriptional regulator with XRE-family HTH domain
VATKTFGSYGSTAVAFSIDRSDATVPDVGCSRSWSGPLRKAERSRRAQANQRSEGEKGFSKGGPPVSMNSRTQLLKKFRNKEYRDSFVAEYISSHIPLKIRGMRDRRGMSQTRLGELAGVKQEWISKLEDPNYGRLTISTLLKIASAFDCGLSVDFVSFSQILNTATDLSARSFDVPSFAEELASNCEPPLPRFATADLSAAQIASSADAPGNTIAVPPTALESSPADELKRADRSRNVVFIDALRKALEGKGQPSCVPVRAFAGNRQKGGLAYAASVGTTG